MAQEDDRPRLNLDPLDPDRFEKLVRFVHECTLVFPVDGRRVVLIQKDARVGDEAWEGFTEPQMALRPRGRAPCVPCMGSGVLASWVQAMDSNDAGDVSYLPLDRAMGMPVLTRPLRRWWKSRPRDRERVVVKAICVSRRWSERENPYH